MIPGIVAQTIQGGNVVPVTSDGVRFDNTGSNQGAINNLSMGETNPTSITMSMWVRCPNISFSPQLLFLGNSFIGIGFQHNSDIQVGLYDNTNANSLTVGTADGVFTTGLWHHLFFSAQTNHGAGSKIYHLLFDGVNVVSAPDTTDTSFSFSLGMNGKEFAIPQGHSFLNLQRSITDFSDVWIAPGQYLDASNVTKFRSAAGKPVNLGAHGQIPTGTEPSFFFTGNASEFIFNSGSGDSVTLIGNATDVTGPP